MKKACLIVMSMAMGALIATPAMAKSLYVSAGKVSVQSQVQAKNLTLTVSGPNGFFEKSFEKTGTPDVSLMRNGQMADGQYTWELTGHTNERVKSYKSSINNGRGDDARKFSYKAVHESGSFMILNGIRVRAEDAPAEIPASRATPKTKSNFK